MTVTSAHSGEGAKLPAAARADAGSTAEHLSVTVALSSHQAMLLDEWISNHSAPKPSRAEALLLHFDWSIARCSSRKDEFPRTREPDFTTGKDFL